MQRNMQQNDREYKIWINDDDTHSKRIIDRRFTKWIIFKLWHRPTLAFASKYLTTITYFGLFDFRLFFFSELALLHFSLYTMQTNWIKQIH